MTLTTNKNTSYKTRLKNSKYVKGLLKAAFEESIQDGNWRAFGLILQDIIDAQGGKTSFAEKTKLSRQHIYRLFGENANPTLKTLTPILAELGCKLTISS